MVVWVQTETTTLLICVVVVLCYPKVLKEKKQKMFVAFFGYPACPVKIM